WMQHVTTVHVRRYHQHYHSSGHVWQGRFKAFPVQPDDHLYTVLRYVERNALRAGLCRKASLWPWTSVRWRGVADALLPVSEWPQPLPADWPSRVNEAQTDAELAAVRLCLARGRPYGTAGWVQRTASRLGLASTLRPRGRPRKENSDD